MSLSTLFFRLIASWPAMMLGNVIILGMVVFVLYTDSEPLASCIIANLRNETISTIVIAWGVLLESRNELMGTALGGGQHGADAEDPLGAESRNSGLLLVCLGLLLEIVTYFDASIHLHPPPSWVFVVLHGVVWMLLVTICVRLLLSCINLARIRVRPT